MSGGYICKNTLIIMKNTLVFFAAAISALLFSVACSKTDFSDFPG